MFRGGLLLFVALSLCVSVLNAQRCSLAAGQVWKGLYRGSERPLGQKDVTISITGPSSWQEISTVATFNVAYGITPSKQIKLRDFETSNPPLLACAPNSVGLYNMNFTADCRTLTLTVDTDFCPRRLVHLHKIVLTLADDRQPCEFTQGDTFRGYYPDNNVLVGKMVNVRFGAGSQITEDSGEATITGQWTIDENGDLVARDVSSFPLTSPFACSPATPAVYSLAWSNNCRQASLKVKNDLCGIRRDRYNGLVLTKVSSTCSFKSGETWTGVTNGNDPRLSGRPIKFGIEEGMAVTAQINNLVVNKFWFIDSSGDLRTRDLSSLPANLACPRQILSQYALTWAKNCTEVVLNLIRDDCVSRSGLTNGLTLTKATAAIEPPVVVNFNFDKLVPATARPCFRV